MIAQHVVSYGDTVTLTRLPAGRAEGFVWLSFVARGIELSPGPGEPWRLLDHVELGWAGGADADVVSSGLSGDETLHLLHAVVRDVGVDTLSIAYVEDGQAISREDVALPPAPAV